MQGRPEVLLEGLARSLMGGLIRSGFGGWGRGHGGGEVQVRHPPQDLEILGVVDGCHHYPLHFIQFQIPLPFSSYSYLDLQENFDKRDNL